MQLASGIWGWKHHFRHKVWKANMFGFVVWWFEFFVTLFQNSYKNWSNTKPNFMNFLLFLKIVCNSLITLKILNLHHKRTKLFTFQIFGIKCCFYPYMPYAMLMLSKTTFPEKLPPFDCITLWTWEIISSPFILAEEGN